MPARRLKGGEEGAVTEREMERDGHGKRERESEREKQHKKCVEDGCSQLSF